eukprot:COSAG06_NODE_958_length_11320_cov_10.832724_7_plen_522_part_00
MPQIPLFVSSAKAGGASNGSFSVNFQPPLELPKSAKNATVEVQQMSVPYTAPNVSAARGNNTVVVQIPNKTRDDFVYRAGSTTDRLEVICTIPDGLYTLDALQAEWNRQINLAAADAGSAAFNHRETAVTHKTVDADGTDGADILEEPVPNWLQFKPDFVKNRLHIKLNYTHSSILFTDARSTLGATLGFTSDILTTTELYPYLTTNAITVDLLYRGTTGAAWSQTSLTLPAAAAGYDVTKIRTDLNALGKTFLLNKGFSGAVFNAFIGSIEVAPLDAESVTVRLVYTDPTLVKLRGDQTDTTSDLSALAAGQLRAGLPNPASTESTAGSSLGNPYKTHGGYAHALKNTVYAADGTAFDSTNTERYLYSFLGSIGALSPGMESTVPLSRKFYTGGEGPFKELAMTALTWVQATNTHDAEAATAAHIDSITEIGLAVEPIVQGPRDTSGKVSGTLARFVIPGGAQPGDVLAFESANPTRVDIQSFVGQDINRLTFRLVDQHNDPVSDLAGEHFSAVVLFSYD